MLCAFALEVGDLRAEALGAGSGAVCAIASSQGFFLYALLYQPGVSPRPPPAAASGSAPIRDGDRGLMA